MTVRKFIAVVALNKQQDFDKRVMTASISVRPAHVDAFLSG